MINFGRKMIGILFRQSCNFSKGPLLKQNTPSSQFQAFKMYMENIEDQQSRKSAVQLLVKLEDTHQLTKQRLEQIEKCIESYENEHPHIIDILNRQKLIQQAIQNQIAENEEIVLRAQKQIDQVKVYGVSKIAKDIIETADFLKQAIKSIEKNIQNTQQKIQQLYRLQSLQKELTQLLKKYEITQFNPLDQPFNPNEHESIGHLPSTSPTQKNLVAEVKRTGFKIKQRLLRSAFVIIYI